MPSVQHTKGSPFGGAPAKQVRGLFVSTPSPSPFGDTSPGVGGLVVCHCWCDQRTAVRIFAKASSERKLAPLGD